jgi:hypothetical protein
MNDAWIDVSLYISYFLIVGSILGAIFLPLVFMITGGDTKTLVRFLAGIAGFFVIYFLCYAVSSNEVTAVYEKATTSIPVTPGVSKAIGGGLVMTYLIGIVTFVGIVFTEVTKFFK